MAETDKFLSLAKSTTTNVSEFVGNTLDPCFTKGLIDTYPNIYKAGTSFYMDFSETSNADDLKFLKRFFNGIPVGSTLSISGGTYFVEETGTQYSFSGTYTFKGKTGASNQYLNFYGDTYSPSLPNGLFESKNFIGRINFSAITGGTCSYYINKVNKEDPFNLKFFGVYGADYGYDEFVEVLGSSLNTGRLKIDSFVRLNDKSELVYLNNQNTITNENLYFTPVTVNYYMRGVPDLVSLSVNTNVNGVLKKLNYDGETIDIFQNQNLRQKYSRELQDKQNQYDWYGFFPSTNYKNLYNPYAYSSMSFTINYLSLLQIATILTYNSDDMIESTYTQSLGLVIDGVETGSVNYGTASTRTTITSPRIKIDLSDASLYSATIEPYTDANCSVPLSISYYLNGVPGFDGASFIYFKNIDSPSTIYLKVTKAGVSMILQINII
jgi:hypothetical protein